MMIRIDACPALLHVSEFHIRKIRSWSLVRWHRLQAVAKVAGCVFGLPGGLVAQARGPVEAGSPAAPPDPEADRDHGDNRFRETRS